MIVTGLDIATTTGLTTRYEDGSYKATTYRGAIKAAKFLDPRQDKKLDGNKEGAIGRKFEDFLHSYLVDNGTAYLAIEEPAPSNMTRKKRNIDMSSKWAGQAITYTEEPGTSIYAIFRIYGMEFLAATVASRLNIPVIFVPQQTWRADFLQNGRPKEAKKEAVKVCQKLGIVVTSEDAAESVGVCWWLHHFLFPELRQGDMFGEKKTLTQIQNREAAEKLFKQT